MGGLRRLRGEECGKRERRTVERPFHKCLVQVIAQFLTLPGRKAITELLKRISNNCFNGDCRPEHD